MNPEERLTINNVLERLAAIAESNNVNLKQPLKFERKKVEQSVATSSPGNKKSSKYYTTISWNELTRRGTVNVCDKVIHQLELICNRASQLSIHPVGPSLCSVAFQSRAKTGQVFFDFLHSNFFFVSSKYLFWIEFLRDVILQCEISLHSNVDYHQKLSNTKGKAMMREIFLEWCKVV